MAPRWVGAAAALLLLCARLAAAAGGPAVVDAPGRYRIEHEGAAVSPSADSERGSKRVGRLLKGMEVDVLEVVTTADGERLRGRIASPAAGWITLGYAPGAKHMKKAGYRWAVPVRGEEGRRREAGEGEVEEGTDDNFFRFRKLPLVLACFHGGSAKKELAAFAEAARELAGQVTFASVDATEELELASEFLGTGFDPRRLPVIIALQKGKVSRYDGPRDARGIVQYMRKVIGLTERPAVRDVADSEAVAELVAKLGNVAVAFVKPGTKEDRAWMAQAERHRTEFVFARAADPEFAKNQQMTRPGVKLFMRDGRTAVFKGGIADAGGGEPGDVVVRWMRAAGLPQFGEIKQRNFLAYAQGGRPIVWLFLGRDAASTAAKEAVREVAGDTALRKHFTFGWADAEEGLGRQVAQRVGAYEKDGDVALSREARDVGRLPNLAITEGIAPGEQGTPPVLFPSDQEVSAAAVRQWLEAALARRSGSSSDGEL
eukprot:TRINITY_DN50191_c0_g1_i1.p1 TRINITY_DN50191_c0_g1~~TRINITY_DN50191_c0_g1_i1.p1  ORF type:complete len:511 (+),score=167.87 TRINITY_DN50191_c0_g1_i1:74-1534(+)